MKTEAFKESLKGEKHYLVKNSLNIILKMEESQDIKNLNTIFQISKKLKYMINLWKQL